MHECSGLHQASKDAVCVVAGRCRGEPVRVGLRQRMCARQQPAAAQTGQAQGSCEGFVLRHDIPTNNKKVLLPLPPFLLFVSRHHHPHHHLIYAEQSTIFFRSRSAIDNGPARRHLFTLTYTIPPKSRHHNDSRYNNQPAHRNAAALKNNNIQSHIQTYTHIHSSRSPFKRAKKEANGPPTIQKHRRPPSEEPLLRRLHERPHLGRAAHALSRSRRHRRPRAARPSPPPPARRRPDSPLLDELNRHAVVHADDEPPLRQQAPRAGMGRPLSRQAAVPQGRC